MACIGPVPPSHATMVSCQPLSSQAMAWTNWSRTLIAGGSASAELRVGRYDRPAAVPIAADTVARGDTGPQRAGQPAPGFGVPAPPPLACWGGAPATTTCLGGGSTAVFLAGLR